MSYQLHRPRERRRAQHNMLKKSALGDICMRDFSLLFQIWIEQLTACITQYIPIEEMDRHYDIVVNSNNTLKESRQIIVADHPPVVYDSLVALGRILNLYESAENPLITLSAGEAVSAGVSALMAGFNLGRSMDEEMAKPLITYIEKFYCAGKRPRKNRPDALDRVIESICINDLSCGKNFPNHHKIIRELCKLANNGKEPHDVIDSVDQGDDGDGVVYWFKNRNCTKPERISFGRIRNRLTDIRKKILAPK